MRDRRGFGGIDLFGKIYSENLDLIIIGPNIHNLIIIWESFNLYLIRCGITYSYIILFKSLLINNIIIFFFFILIMDLLINSLSLYLFLGVFYFMARSFIIFFIKRSGMLRKIQTWL